MFYQVVRVPLCGLFLMAGLSACSGESGTSSSPPPTLAPSSAEGLWIGTTNTNRTVAGLVLDDGAYWLLYSVVANPSIIAGLVQGDSSAQNGTFISSNARDFSVERQGVSILDARIDGSYTTKHSLNGTIVYPVGGQDTFTTTYDSNYDLPPDVNAIAGTYTGSVALNETVNVTVTTAGGISGNSSTGCTFAGSFSPRANGNAFDVTITFGGQAACSNGTDTVRGVGFYEAGTKRLYSAALNTARTNGFVFIGIRL